MTPAPNLAYHGKLPETPGKVPDELPDTILTESRRRELKTFVEVEALTLDPHELMYLACALKDAARRKFAREDRS